MQLYCEIYKLKKHYNYAKVIFCESFAIQKNSCNFVEQLVLIKKQKNMAYVISDDCVACGTCIGECPVGAISEGEIYSINPDMCTECGTCADVCPSEAIH